GERVLRERGEHVVEERHRGADLAAAGAVEVHLDLDGGLGRAAGALRGARAGAGVAHEGDPIDARASRNAVDSASVPAVTRRWPGMPTSRISTPRSYSACQTALGSATPPKRTKFDQDGCGR